MAAEDPSLLALVLDDPLAPVVLAWWKARRPGRSLVAVSDAPLGARSRLSKPEMAELCRVSRQSRFQVEATLERCEIAGLFEGGGIAPVADKWLRTHVAQQLGAGRPPARAQASPAQAPVQAPRKRERGGVTLALVVAVAAAVALSLCLAARPGLDALHQPSAARDPQGHDQATRLDRGEQRGGDDSLHRV